MQYCHVLYEYVICRTSEEVMLQAYDYIVVFAIKLHTQYPPPAASAYACYGVIAERVPGMRIREQDFPGEYSVVKFFEQLVRRFGFNPAHIAEEFGIERPGHADPSISSHP